MDYEIALGEVLVEIIHVIVVLLMAILGLFNSFTSAIRSMDLVALREKILTKSTFTSLQRLVEIFRLSSDYLGLSTCVKVS
jgi:hypothetical protein